MEREKILLIVILLVLLTVLMVARALHITGRMTATDQEAQECYFGIGKDVMITARPDSEECQALRLMVGKEVNLSVF